MNTTRKTKKYLSESGNEVANRLNFIVAGTPKSGTTPLYEYIKDHPGIIMPASKELPFFSEGSVYSKGIDWYYSQLPDPKDKILGTVTPQYVMGSEDTSAEQVAKRMYKALGNDVKLVVLFREPIARAFSHYKMIRRRGYEKRDFAKAMADSLDKHQQGELKLTYQAEPFVGSAYADNIRPFVERFDAKNMLFLFAKDLKADQAGTLKTFFNFIGADDTWLPPEDVGTKEVHKGGMAPKYGLLTPKNLKKIPGLSSAWGKVPYSLKKRVEFGINSWNIKADDKQPDQEVGQAVRDFFTLQSRDLEKHIKLDVPWLK